MRLSMYNQWRKGITPVMICTSAFSTGNDYAHVRLTIHFKMALEMSELIQAQGRSGRDGKAARCFIIPASNPQLPKISKEAEDHKGQWYAYDYVYRLGTKRCLRYGTTLYIDGKGLECKDDLASVPCSVCKAESGFKARKLHTRNMSMPILHTTSEEEAGPTNHHRLASVSKHELKDPFADATHTSKKRRVDRLAGAMDEANQMRRALDRVKDHGCGACLVMGFRPEHATIHACQALQAAGGFGALMQWKKTIRYPPSVGRKGICWKCHVPSCSDMLHGDFEGAKTKCDWEDVVIPTLMAIRANRETRERAQRELGTMVADWVAYASWLVGEPSAGYYSRVMELFLWYVERVVGFP